MQTTFSVVRTFGQSRVERILFGCILENESVSPVALKVVGGTQMSNSSVTVRLLMEERGVQRERRGGMCVMPPASAVCLLYCEFFGVSNHLCVSLVQYAVAVSPL